MILKLRLKTIAYAFFYQGKQMPNEQKPHFTLITNLGLKVTSLYKFGCSVTLFVV